MDKGAVVTVPSIVNLPYFTTVPYNAVPLDQATADLLNAGYAAYNGGLQAAFAANWNRIIHRRVKQKNN